MIKKFVEFVQKNKRTLASTVLVLLLAAVFLWRFQSQQNARPTVATAAPSAGTVVLRISGAVQRPGQYDVRPGSSLADNLELFGGFESDANLENVRLDEPITKAKSIHIPARKKHGLDQSQVDELYRAP